MAMLKSIADQYPYAVVNLFGKIKVFFLHGADDQLHLWSLSFKHDGIYELLRETHLTILPSFDDKADLLPDLLRFYWTMNVSHEPEKKEKTCILVCSEMYTIHYFPFIDGK
ncbi:uncharacterized protein BX664DRAFT_320871 [Halteromyces radiatus]|uniref:uncharacterized protein n=1 Tax=Halteromyces radiatus TaxID=101107 RepID=UPI00221E52BA|nr:uncharacterized protein BX664DRAFT_320871 [Halteromyces radiatus]KAI8099259.1 hypothetical protein BX664DRAFT_320871 [Halteromyces radiatus]